MNEFYVYEWIRLDTNEPFYVGKGKDNRAYVTHTYLRNKYFNRIVNKVGLDNVAVVLLHENLNEITAHEYEIYYISLYRDELGFGLANITDGGEGTAGGTWTLSEETKKNMSEAHWLKGKGHLIEGKNNPFYQSKTFVGENNPMYGKRGKDHPAYGKGKKGKENHNYGRTGKNHPASQPIVVFKDDKFIGEFDSVFEFAKTMGCEKNTDPIGKGVSKLINGWIPQYGRFVGYRAMKKSEYESKKVRN